MAAKRRFKSLEEAIDRHRHFGINNVLNNLGARVRVRTVYSHVPPGARVLDIGCNDGHFGRMLIELKGCEVHGVDVSKDVEVEASQNGIYFNLCPIEKTPFKDNFFDVAISCETFEHVYDIDMALKEVYRVLKPSGILLGTVPHPEVDSMGEEEHHQRVFSESGMRKALSKYFKVLTISPIIGECDTYNENTGKLIKVFRGKKQHIFFKAVKL